MPPTKNSSSSADSSDETLKWVLIGVAVLLFIAIMIVIFFIVRTRRKRSAKKTPPQAPLSVKVQKEKRPKELNSIEEEIQQNRSQVISTLKLDDDDGVNISKKKRTTKDPSSSKKKQKNNVKEVMDASNVAAGEGITDGGVKGKEGSKGQQPPSSLKEVSAIGDYDDEVKEDAMVVKESKDNKKASENEEATKAEEKKKKEMFEKEKMEFTRKAKEIFETPDWDRKHMPPNCDYKLFMASSSMLRFCMMEYLRAHADEILISHGYLIVDGQAAEAPRSAYKWLRSSELNDDDAFLRSRAWMLENCGIFKHSPVTQWLYFNKMEIPLLYMAAMKESIKDPQILDKILSLTWKKASKYFTLTPKNEWELNDHPMKVLAKIFVEGKPLDLPAIQQPSKVKKIEAK